MRQRPAGTVLKERIDPSLGRRGAGNRQPSRGGTDDNRGGVRTGSRYRRPHGTGAIAIRHERRRDADRLQGDRQDDRTGRSIGLSGGGLGCRDEKAGDNRRVPARGGQIGCRLREVAGTERTVERLTRDQTAGRRVSADESVDSIERRSRQ